MSNSHIKSDSQLQPGEKVNDYWEPGKGLLSDPGKFLESLFKFDKDNIPDDVIKKIQPFIDNPDFTPAAIAKVRQGNFVFYAGKVDFAELRDEVCGP